MLPLSLTLVSIVCAALTAALCVYALPLAERLGVVDFPSPPGSGGHKQHAAPTPAVGGVILAIVALTSNLALLPYTVDLNAQLFPVRLIAFAAILAAMIIGFVDDRVHLRAGTRLSLATALAAVLLVLVPQYAVTRIHFTSINLELHTGMWAFPFSVLCLVALKNAINMTDGKNGLLLGMSLIWTTFFLFHATPPMLPGLACVAGALVVLFIFNWRGKLFMGDCGSYGLATLFGVLALSLHQDTFGNVTSAEAILLFLIPVLDTSRLVFERIASGRSPLAADQRHLHHLLDHALGWRRGWFVYMALVAVPIAVYQVTSNYGVPIICVATLAYALVIVACTNKAAFVLPRQLG